nr:MAG TPA: hypothetical protein [Crassvirales sp.]
MLELISMVLLLSIKKFLNISKVNLRIQLMK